MVDKKKDEAQSDAASKSESQSAADAAGILGAQASASGFASENQGEKTVVKPATSDTLSGPMADLSADGNAEAFMEQGANKEFVVDEKGRGTGTIVSKLPINASSDYPGRDEALAATDGGREMPGNLDAILRAQHAGTQIPGDAQLLSKEQIAALKAEFVDGAEFHADSGAGSRFVESEGDPNHVFHGDKEIDPNIPTNEIVRGTAKR